MNIISEKIIADAKTEAQSLLSKVKTSSLISMKHAKEKAALQKEESLKKTKLKALNLSREKFMQAGLELKKEEMLTRQQLISSAVEESEKVIINLPAKEYREIFKKIIMKNAENNDEIIISKKDEKIITEDLVEKISKEKKIKLKTKISPEISHGIIISGKSYDKNFILDKVFNSIREKLETEIDKILLS